MMEKEITREGKRKGGKRIPGGQSEVGRWRSRFGDDNCLLVDLEKTGLTSRPAEEVACALQTANKTDFFLFPFGSSAFLRWKRVYSSLFLFQVTLF